MIKGQWLALILLMVVGMVSFSESTLGIDDYEPPLENGKIGLDLAYDSEQTVGFALKLAPIKDVQLSAEYSLPSGTAFTVDQVKLGAWFTLAERSWGGLDYGVKLNYDNTAKTVGLTGTAILQDKDYNVHGNVSYVADSPLIFSVAGEFVTEPVHPVGALSITGTDFNGLLGLRYEPAEGYTFDVGATFPIAGSGSSSQFVGFMAEF